MGDPHLNEAFLFNRDRPDRLRGANPSAEIAEFLTVSDSGNESRGVKTSKACLQEGRLKRIVGTDLQTLPAPVQTETNLSSGKDPGGRISRLFFNPLSDWRGLVLITRDETKPKAKDPKTYLLERFTPSTVFQLGEMQNRKETALGGHSRHLKQEMQSCWRYCSGVSSGMAPTGHSLTHFWQWVQSSVTDRLKIRKREEIEKRVPRGQR